MRIHHSGLIVSDLDRSIAFYCRTFGMELVTVPPDDFRSGAMFDAALGLNAVQIRMATLRLGDSKFELLEYRTPRSAQETAIPKYTIGAGHIAIEVDDIVAKKTEMEQAGIQFLSDINRVEAGPQAGFHWVYCLDPDGSVIELVQIAYEDLAARQPLIDAYKAKYGLE